MFLSQRVLIKDNVYRSVQVTPTGRAIWVAHINGKSTSVCGKIQENTFIANEKYIHLIDQYTPKRQNYKPSGVAIKISWNHDKDRTRKLQRDRSKRINDKCRYVKFLGDIRKITYSTKTCGRINHNGINYYGTIDSEFNFIPISSRKRSK